MKSSCNEDNKIPEQHNTKNNKKNTNNTKYQKTTSVKSFNLYVTRI